MGDFEKGDEDYSDIVNDDRYWEFVEANYKEVVNRGVHYLNDDEVWELAKKLTIEDYAYERSVDKAKREGRDRNAVYCEQFEGAVSKTGILRRINRGALKGVADNFFQRPLVAMGGDEKLPLRPEISSEEEFNKALAAGWAEGLKFASRWTGALQPDQLEELQHRVFGKILASE